MVDSTVVEPSWSHIFEAVYSSHVIKHQVLKLATEGTSKEWLELTPVSSVYIDGLGPIDPVRIVISPTLLYQVSVTHPFLRTVDRLKGTILVW